MRQGPLTTGILLAAWLGACQARPADPAAANGDEASRLNQATSRVTDEPAQAPTRAPTLAQAPLEQPPARQPQPASPQPKPAPLAPVVAAPGTPGGLADDRTPISEGPIEANGAQGAGQVLQRYGGLLEQKRFGEAWALWSNGGKASGLSRSDFAASFAKYRELHAEVGRPGQIEGAAGSLYVEVPFHLYGRLASGARFNLVGPMTLRRVNNVEGSSEAQRHWHIERSDLK